MYRGTSPIFDVPEVPLMRRIKSLPKRRVNGESMLAGVPLPGPDASAEELLAHADSLSSTLALSSYYLTSSYAALEQQQQTDDDDRDRDGDWNNTKKRKVPANIQPALGHDLPDPNEDEDPQPSIEPLELASPNAQPVLRKTKLSRSTVAGLQHKEMLKVRKRQLASVLGALSHGDTLALDQALSATFPIAYPSFDDRPPKVRLSKRRSVRMARATRLAMKHPHPDQLPLISHFDFSFSCPSPTADRLVATKEEVANLRARFEEELTRQASKAAQVAASNKAIMSSSPSKHRGSKRERPKQRTRTAAYTPPSLPESVDQSLGLKPKSNKKKKRSALANASNPHHLRNYVPSRLPHSGGQAAANQANLNLQNLLSPIPIAFLSAEIPPRTRKQKKAQRSNPGVQLTNPADEWICPYCEYELYYGDESDYRRAIRNRKKILRRRRRARERASAAASGNGAALHKKDKENDDEYDDDEEEGYDDEDEDEYAGNEPARWEDSGQGRAGTGALG